MWTIFISINKAYWNFGFKRYKSNWLSCSSFNFYKVLLNLCVSRSFISNVMIILALVMRKVFFNYFCVQIENIIWLHWRRIVISRSDSLVCILPVFISELPINKVFTCFRIKLFSTSRIAHYLISKDFYYYISFTFLV